MPTEGQEALKAIRSEMKKLLGYLGLVLILAVFVVGFVAYFIFSFEPQTRVTYDGLGRQLTDSPWLVRLILGEDKQWAGWRWFLVDMVVFWGTIGVGFSLVSWGLKKKN